MRKSFWIRTGMAAMTMSMLMGAVAMADGEDNSGNVAAGQYSLNAANAEISVKEAELQNLQQTYSQMQEEIDYLMSDEYIDNWAAEHGMVRGN